MRIIIPPKLEESLEIARLQGKHFGAGAMLCDDCVISLRVLIVDDHEPFRTMARSLLEGAGYVISGEAADAAEALAAVVADAPDAVLLDVQLPDRDGFSVAIALMAMGGGPAVVLISSRDA